MEDLASTVKKNTTNENQTNQLVYADFCEAVKGRIWLVKWLTLWTQMMKVQENTSRIEILGRNYQLLKSNYLIIN